MTVIRTIDLIVGFVEERDLIVVQMVEMDPDASLGAPTRTHVIAVEAVEAVEADNIAIAVGVGARVGQRRGRGGTTSTRPLHHQVESDHDSPGAFSKQGNARVIPPEFVNITMHPLQRRALIH